jgi:hypothetical protein
MPIDLRFHHLPLGGVNRLCRSAALLVLSLLLPPVVHAQLPPTDSLIVPGARLRFQLADSSRSYDGRLRELRGDTLIIEDRGVRTSVLAARVTGIQVQRRAPTLSRNVTIGGVIGMLGTSGMYLGWCANNREECRQQNQTDDHYYPEDGYHHHHDDITMGALAVIGGALLGGVVGYALTPTEWVEAGVPLRLGTTRHGGIRLSGSLAFR